MTGRPRPAIPAPFDLVRLLVAFGLVPVTFAYVGASNDRPPWAFALIPSWSIGQIVFVALAGALLGVTSKRPAAGLAGVTFGILLGLATDLWWLAGQVTAVDQTYVSLLSPADWHQRFVAAVLALLGALWVGFLGGCALRIVRTRSGTRVRRPTRAEAAVIGVAGIGGLLLALGIAYAAAASAMLVPEGSQVENVWVSPGAVVVDPVALRPGPTRFRCHVAAGMAPAWAYFWLPTGANGEPIPPARDYVSVCEVGRGGVSWGPVADLQPGRYVWSQIDNSTEPLQATATTPVTVATP